MMPPGGRIAMIELPVLLIAIIVMALLFDFTNGAHDCANAIATVISTNVMSPRQAVTMAAGLNLLGAFIGTRVAHTVGAGIVKVDMVSGSQILVLAALMGAIIWNLLTWYLGLPSSSSHALIGGLCGAAVMHRGWSSLNYVSIIEKVILPLLISPLVGFIGGYFLMIGIFWLLRRANRGRTNEAFRRLQIVSSAFMATSHGMNDAQKTMGIITLALYIFHRIPDITIPFWVKLACAMAMAFGTAQGGWKIIKTMGHRIFKMQAVHGFAAETSAAMVITSATAFGAPISTTHTISSAVMGVGASKRFSAVRWGVAGRMVVAWVLTIPAAAILAALFMELIDLIGLG
jgi:inorganic phosphate transporter, PiT family